MLSMIDTDQGYVAGASLAIASIALSYAVSSAAGIGNANVPFSANTIKKQQRWWYCFGSIRFNSTHGVSGFLSTLLTFLAIAVHQYQTIPMIPPVLFDTTMSIFAAVASVIAASSGMPIIDQAPKQTVVMQWPLKVVPPHRDAFRRTAYSIYYLCARICWNEAPKKLLYLFNDSTILRLVGDWIFGCTALCYAMKYFIPHPREIDWANGNTYVFVIPMALGLTADALFQLPILQCHHFDTTTTCWNEHIIAQLDLLYVLLSGLAVAFVFTLAFRGVLGIRKCYWGAALVVHGIVGYLIMKALPFVQMKILPSC